MKITKYIHSCLLIEEQDKTVLIDPGLYSYNEHVFPFKTLEKLDTVLITHEHPDHMYLPFIKEILNKFPKLTIISNSSVQKILGESGISVTTENNEFVRLEEKIHEKVFDKNPPVNAVFTVFGKLTHPGDCINFSSASEIIAWPIHSFWSGTTMAMNKILELHPKVVIPMHEYPLKDEFREDLYERIEKYLFQHGIQLRNAETGKTFIV